MTETQRELPVIIEEGPYLPEVLTDEWVGRFEKGIEVYKRFQVAAFRLTNPSHWVRQGEKYYLQGPGAEALMNPLGMNFDAPTFRVEDRADEQGSYFIIWCEGYMESKTLGRRGYYIGSCDSRDQFFLANEKMPRPVLEQNVRKSAYTNWIVNAVSRLAGIRNPDEAMLRAAGVDVSRVPKPDYSGRRTPEQEVAPISEPQRKRLWAICKQAGITEEQLKNYLDIYAIESTAAIPRGKYDEVVSWVQKTGEEMKREHSPGPSVQQNLGGAPE